MKNLQMYCISLNPDHLDLIKKLNYIPVGLGDKKFSEDWQRDKTENSIADKNPYYGEYTFHYWLWKNNKINFDGWIGFCQYRKFWKKNTDEIKINNFLSLDSSILKEVSIDLMEY